MFNVNDSCKITVTIGWCNDEQSEYFEKVILPQFAEILNKHKDDLEILGRL